MGKRKHNVQKPIFSASALQHCGDIVSNGCNVVPTLQGCVALKIVVACITLMQNSVGTDKLHYAERESRPW